MRGLPLSHSFLQSDARMLNNSTQKPSKQLLTQLASELIDFFSTSKCMELKPGALKLLQALKQNPGLQLGIISNYDSRLTNLLIETKLTPFFNFAIISHEIQISKPNPLIFIAALNKVKNICPMQALHIGDNYDLDFIGAQEAGWNAILIGKDNDKVQKKNKNAVDKEKKQTLIEIIPDLDMLLKYFIQQGKTC